MVTKTTPAVVNDIHSRLNPTEVRAVVAARSDRDVARALARARRDELPLALCGGRHAMGGQQFCRNGLLLDLSGCNNIVAFDADSGLIEVQAGIQWPQLIDGYQKMQRGRPRQWSIRQKQTGADRLSIGGALAANIHGRVLNRGPLIEDVVRFRLMTADGDILECSRDHNRELFGLVIGGYGLFGVVLSVTLQLVPRTLLQRVVESCHLEALPHGFKQRQQDGYLYGDFQFVTDERSSRFLRHGIFSCYRPAVAQRFVPSGQLYMTESRWQQLLLWAHEDKDRAFSEFADFYGATSGQYYWSDTHQLSLYLDDYHRALDSKLCDQQRGSEMITELYVPLDRLTDFMAQAADTLRRHGADLIYGTVRLIRKDDESFLAWAREDFACVIFNLHVTHNPTAQEASARVFEALIDDALGCSGSFFLTYHRHASVGQVMTAYPQFEQFMAHKRQYDPQGRFISDWYRHYNRQLAGHQRSAASAG